MVGGELLGAYCLSEPQGGSDAASLTTRAEVDGDDYVITGTKAWITHAGVADFYNVFCRTGGPGADGISCLLADADTPGIAPQARERTMGLRSSPVAQIAFDGARVPADRLLGDEGTGFRIAMSALDSGGSASPRARSDWPRRRWTTPPATPGSASSSAGASSTSRASGSCWPTWRPRSRRPGR
jgi:alkylation response protein AidB-like acyl-CoA dehydrogenase